MKLLLKKIALLIFCLLFSVSPFHAKKADAWIATEIASLDTALEVAWETIQGAMTGIAKQGAAMALMSNMTSFIGGGSSGGGMFIKNWTDNLIKGPLEQSDLFIDDYISQTIGGGKGSGYEGFDGNYLKDLGESAKALTSGRETPKTDFEGDPEKMFAEKDGLKQLNSYLSGINNPWAYKMNATNAYKEKMEQEQKMAEVPAIANQGFLSKGGNGDVSLPGSLLKNNAANVQDIGNKVMAGSGSMSEVMITTVLNSTISQMMMEGF